MKCVLITGATGAIGSALVPLFLREEETSVRLVIRAKSVEHLRERVKTLCDFWGLDVDVPPVSDRLGAVIGDVTQPRLGIDESDYGRLVGEVTHVVHAAGNVKLNQTIEQARASAVDAARHILELVEKCRQGDRFRKLDFVSTLGVAGRMRGSIPERPLEEAREFHNTYEQAKAEAETLLLSEMDKGLPATIHRPSMVVGDSETGKVIHFQVFYYLSEFLSGKRTLGFLPDPGEVKLDLIPTDYVAQAICVSCDRADAVGRIFHLCTGASDSLAISEIARQVHDLYRSLGDRLARQRVVSRTAFRLSLRLASAFVSKRTRRALQTLPFFLDYLEEQQTFENDAAKAYFEEVHISIPDPAKYLTPILRHYRASTDRTGR